MTLAGDSAPVKILKGASLVFAGLVFARLCSYAYRVVLARSGGAEEFGILFLGIATITVVGTLASLGFGLGVSRYVPFFLGKNDESSARGVLRYSIATSLASGLLFCLALWKLGPPAAIRFLDNQPLAEVMKICALCLPFYVVGRLLVKAVVAFQKIGYRVAVHQVLNPVVRLALTLVLLAAGMGAEGALWAYLAAEAMSCLALWWILERRVFAVFLGKDASAKHSSFQVRSYLAYSLPLFMAGMMDLLMNFTDAFMADHFLDAAQVGIYGAAVTLVTIVATGNELLNPMFLSIITREYAAGNNDKVVANYNNNNRWCLYLTLPAAAMLILFCAPVMTLLWGPEFSTGARALAILTLGRSLYYLAHTSGFVLSMHGASRYFFAANSAAALLNVSLNYLLIPRLGITGAALATSLSLCLLSWLLIHGAQRYHRGQGMRVLDMRIVVSAALSAVLLLPVAYYIRAGWAVLFGAGAIYIALFLLILWLLRAYSTEDRMIRDKLMAKLRG
ncbi:MAG: flippase [Gemmatimonadota bacterium]|nr:flippase [Gemmatimonadota bacterium]